MRTDYHPVNLPGPVYRSIRAESERTDIPLNRLVRRAWEAYMAGRENEVSEPAPSA